MKYKTIIVSDIHLGTKDSQAKEFLKFLDEHPTEQLILNGDIVDGWALLKLYLSYLNYLRKQT